MADLVETVARLIDPTAFQLADELLRVENGRHRITGEPVPDDLRTKATADATALIAKARGKTHLAIAAVLDDMAEPSEGMLDAGEFAQPGNLVADPAPLWQAMLAQYRKEMLG